MQILQFALLQREVKDYLCAKIVCLIGSPDQTFCKTAPPCQCPAPPLCLLALCKMAHPFPLCRMEVLAPQMRGAGRLQDLKTLQTTETGVGGKPDLLEANNPSATTTLPTAAASPSSAPDPELPVPNPLIQCSMCLKSEMPEHGTLHLKVKGCRLFRAPGSEARPVHMAKDSAALTASTEETLKICAIRELAQKYQQQISQMKLQQDRFKVQHTDVLNRLDHQTNVNQLVMQRIQFLEVVAESEKTARWRLQKLHWNNLNKIKRLQTARTRLQKHVTRSLKRLRLKVKAMPTRQFQRTASQSQRIQRQRIRKFGTEEEDKVSVPPTP